MSGHVPTHGVPRLRGKMTAHEALKRLLHDSGLRARRVAANVYRLEPAPRRKRWERENSAGPAPPIPAIADIIVTGRKVSESLSDVPAPLSVFLPDQVPAMAQDSAGSAAVAGQVPALSSTNVMPGGNRLFIRGVADSPFDGFSQSTVATQIDDARATYDAPDPDLRLVDVDRVEILKGPQGPLYGTGALGGVYRIVTNRPVLGSTAAQLSSHTDLAYDGQIGGGATGMINLPLITDRLAVRAVGYGSYRPGWIDDRGLQDNTNWSRTTGGRIAIRYAPVSGWTLDGMGWLQTVRTGDSQYVTANAETLSRTVQIREPGRARFGMLSATLNGPVGRLDLTVATSIDWQNIARTYDASDSADALDATAPLRFDDTRRYQVFDQEIRIASNVQRKLHWFAGLSYLSAISYGKGVLTDAGGMATTLVDVRRQSTEMAIFGQVGFRLLPKLSVDIGTRLFRNDIEDERDRSTGKHEVNRFTGVSPSVSLGWHASPGLLVYFRYASAIRPGGVALGGDMTQRFDADQLANFDLGLRLQSPSGKLSVDAAAFRSSWTDIQSDYLLDTGLIATRNVGDAHALGLDLNVAWVPLSGWKLVTALSVQHARLWRTADGVRLSTDRRIPVVPDVSGSVKLDHDFSLGTWRADIAGSVRYIGPTRLSFDPGLDRRTPGYALTGVEAHMARGPIEFGLSVDNAANIRADSFAFGNPFSIRETQQYTPLRPRTITLSARYSF